MSRLPHTHPPFLNAPADAVPGNAAAFGVPKENVVIAKTGARVSVAWRDRVTARESEILDRLARGLLYREIGAELGIRTPTVKNHLHRIYSKIEVRSRTEATVKWLAVAGAPHASPTPPAQETGE